MIGIIPVVTTKCCVKCGRDLPLAEFGKHSGKWYRAECKACRSAYNKQYREAHDDQIKAHKREVYYANREQELAKRAIYQKSNQTRIREYQRNYRAQNQTSKRAMNKRWRLANEEYIKETNRHWRKQNPKRRKVLALRYETAKRNLPVDFTEEDWAYALGYFRNCCAVCGRQLNGLFHRAAADHWIPLASPDCPGTIVTNMIPLCHGQDGCNNQKGKSNPDEWLVVKLGKTAARKKCREIAAYFVHAVERRKGDMQP